MSESPERMTIHAELDETSTPLMHILPDTRIIKVGGQSIMDRGSAALFPFIKEVAECAKDFHILLGAGGGTRARHAYQLGLDLEVPTGIMARVGGAVPRQNARMLQMLLAKEGGIYIMPDDFEKLPLYFRLGCIPIMSGMPPHEYWEKPAPGTRIPPNRTDAGVFLAAEALGCPMCYFAKDEKGLFTDDPKKNPDAEFIPEISAKELIERDLNDLVVERSVIEYLTRAQSCKKLHIFNVMEPGNLRRALSGEHVGTIIYAD
ncbi:MAG: uridine kinase [Chrysiogenetes bacterium]|nr:uridine kinase [Chrysiogenetes bacterium]